MPQYLTSAFRGNKITRTFFQAFSLDSDTHWESMPLQKHFSCL